MRIKSFINQYRWSSFPRILKALGRKIGIVSETFFLLKYEINKTDIINKFNELDYSDVQELSEKNLYKIGFFNEEKLALYKERFDKGSYSCYAIVNDDEIQYLTWISWHNMNYPTFFDKCEALESNQALLEDSYCSPNHRGKGYHSKMNIYRLKKILDKGKSEVLVLVLKENKPALKVQYRSGFYHYKTIKYIKIGIWSRVFQKKHIIK
ncbi:hypothetical protein DFR65_1117 [Oceanihabitans sediminis]|uniref:N-acetyltransferase domain-containing protein n=1 Tax=Oceanihabitans sediminis TaxID=1812012 RepID=A0A368P9M3_9FLAO|nr:hypothetical protein [Oceanihabitans sediminis]RBP27058.1 hypothetical protein DFR65_1117 [Oceanihabitans sediminis]RCU58625.1 hypothetical protein DU428_04405 [Oceanihabitans sediminis]